MRRISILVSCTALSIGIASCEKPASDAAADAKAASGAPAAAVDRSADERAIVAGDSAWVRHLLAKNLDSLMMWYTPDAVSYGFGAPAAGTDKIRAMYTEMMKSTVTNPKVNSNTVRFSDDGNMAFDHGTFSMTITAPGGKPATEPAAFLNVWKKVNGQWKLAVEMSTPLPPPPK